MRLRVVDGADHRRVGRVNLDDLHAGANARDPNHGAGLPIRQNTEHPALAGVNSLKRGLARSEVAPLAQQVRRPFSHGWQFRQLPRHR